MFRIDGRVAGPASAALLADFQLEQKRVRAIASFAGFVMCCDTNYKRESIDCGVVRLLEYTGDRCRAFIFSLSLFFLFSLFFFIPINSASISQHPFHSPFTAVLHNSSKNTLK